MVSVEVYGAGALCVVVYIMVEGVPMWQSACLWPEIKEGRGHESVLQGVGEYTVGMYRWCMCVLTKKGSNKKLNWGD